MRCATCLNDAVIDQPPRCKEHFLREFEERVRSTIERHELIKPGMRIAVAASGGKDSLTGLHLLRGWYDDVTAIAIDEGIDGYREFTLQDLRAACCELDVPLIVKTYEELTGFTLDRMLERRDVHPCTICGTFRRHLIARASERFDVLATGHNMDDEAQTLLMNLIRGNTDVLFRGGPKTGRPSSGFTQRVKPLYWCTEKEVATYAFLKGFTSRFTECPNARDGYRYVVRSAMNEHMTVGAKRMMLQRFLAMKAAMPDDAEPLSRCSSCGEASNRETCKACEFVQIVRA